MTNLKRASPCVYLALVCNEPYSKIHNIMDTQAWFPLHMGHAPASVNTNNGNKALQVATMVIVPYYPGRVNWALVK
jgi:hypothetical protein